MAAWTKTEIFKFIELYEKEACIWNPKHRQHKNKLKVNAAWDRIAATLGISVTEAKRKKEVLMTTFRHNHKKVISSHRSRAGKDKIFTPIWIYYYALAAFMSDVYDSKSMLHQKVQNRSQLSLSDLLVNDELSSEAEDETVAQTTLQTSIPMQKRRRSHKLLELQESNTQVKNELSMLNYVLSDNKKNQCEDECDLYGRLLAKKLRQYTEIDKQDLMYEIDGLLLKKLRSNHSSESQVIRNNRPSTSPRTRSNHSQPHYKVGNSSLSDHSDCSPSSPTEDESIHRRPSSSSFNADNQISSIDTTVTSSKQLPVLYILDQSEEAYH